MSSERGRRSGAGVEPQSADRVVGLISGMIFAFFFTIFSECDKYALGTGFAFVVMVAFYVRVSSRQHSYAGVFTWAYTCATQTDGGCVSHMLLAEGLEASKQLRQQPYR